MENRRDKLRELLEHFWMYKENGYSSTTDVIAEIEGLYKGETLFIINESLMRELKRLKEELDSTNQGLILQLKNGDILYEQLLELKESRLTELTDLINDLDRVDHHTVAEELWRVRALLSAQEKKDLNEIN